MTSEIPQPNSSDKHNETRLVDQAANPAPIDVAHEFLASTFDDGSTEADSRLGPETQASMAALLAKQARAYRKTRTNPGHVIRTHSDKTPSREAPGARLSPESSRKLQRELAELRSKQMGALASGEHVYINTRNHNRD